MRKLFLAIFGILILAIPYGAKPIASLLKSHYNLPLTYDDISLSWLKDQKATHVQLQLRNTPLELTADTITLKKGLLSAFVTPRNFEIETASLLCQGRSLFDPFTIELTQGTDDLLFTVVQDDNTMIGTFKDGALTFLTPLDLKGCYAAGKTSIPFAFHTCAPGHMRHLAIEELNISEGTLHLGPLVYKPKKKLRSTLAFFNKALSKKTITTTFPPIPFTIEKGEIHLAQTSFQVDELGPVHLSGSINLASGTLDLLLALPGETLSNFLKTDVSADFLFKIPLTGSLSDFSLDQALLTVLTSSS